MTSEYPAISHTFILREVEELRRRGIRVDTFSVRPATKEGVITEADKRELGTTFVLVEAPYFKYVKSTVAAAVRSPRRFLKTARTAVKLHQGGPRGWFKWGAYFTEAIYLSGELQRRKIEHLHNHFSNSSCNVALLASTFTGIPYSFVLHGMAEREFPTVAALKDQVEHASFLATICDFNRSQAFRMIPVDLWPKVHIARCGIELSNFPHRPHVPREPGPIRILSVARLSIEKGIPGLIEAFDIAVKKGLDAELIMIGDGPQRKRVEQEIIRRGLEGRVFLRGRQAGDVVRAAFVRADIFALPSLMEGLPIVLMESMATGTPVIAPTLAGIPELVIDNDTGLLFAPANWEQLADCMFRLGSDDDLRTRLAAAGRKKVEQQHDIRRSVLPLLELLEPGVDDADAAPPAWGSAPAS